MTFRKYFYRSLLFLRNDFSLLHSFVDLMQWDADHDISPQLIATQVKEKLGSLRFRIRPPTAPRRHAEARARTLNTAVRNLRRLALPSRARKHHMRASARY